MREKCRIETVYPAKTGKKEGYRNGKEKY